MWDLIDASPHDQFTMALAAGYALVIQIGWRPRGLERFLVDMSYGLSLYPYVLLSLAWLSSSAVQALISSNRPLLSMAGLVALGGACKRLSRLGRVNAESSSSMRGSGGAPG